MIHMHHGFGNVRVWNEIGAEEATLEQIELFQNCIPTDRFTERASMLSDVFLFIASASTPHSSSLSGRWKQAPSCVA